MRSASAVSRLTARSAREPAASRVRSRYQKAGGRATPVDGVTLRARRTRAFRGVRYPSSSHSRVPSGVYARTPVQVSASARTTSSAAPSGGAHSAHGFCPGRSTSKRAVRPSMLRTR
ncbi:hypothetical protein [Streptomyces tanashiensis]|uniref:hypothetical protein n=1 Tax=Streptomyces tanashiensis TaxID=67367 RepID=UPI001E4A6B95|nr:hypothetical protein [Streptomyces tanashiensis]